MVTLGAPMIIILRGRTLSLNVTPMAPDQVAVSDQLRASRAGK